MPTLRRRTYRDASDVARLQAFNAAAVQALGYRGYLHVGDIPHRMFNAHRFEDVSRLLHIWEDGVGEVAAWGLVFPVKHPGFDLQVRPDLHEVDLESELVAFLAAETSRQSSERSSGEVMLGADVYAGDSVRAEALRRNGYTPGEDRYFLTAREIGRLRPVDLPPGYVTRAVVGPEDAAALADEPPPQECF